MKTKNKGFSLIELIVAVAILSVFVVILSPSILSTTADIREKSDEAAIANLTSTIQSGTQQSAIFKDAKKVANKTKLNQVTFYYIINDENVLTYDYAEIDTNDGKFTDKTSTAQTVDLIEYTTKLKNHINGVLEPIEIQSEYYLSNKYKIVVTFTDVDFKVNAEWSLQ